MATTTPTEATKARRKRKSGKVTRLYAALVRRGTSEAVSTGWLLSIDPASGAASPPGYAVFHAGVLKESGTLSLGSPATDQHVRLFELGRTLRDELRAPTDDGVWDALVVEDVPDKAWKRGPQGDKFGSVKRQKSLHRSVGSVLASAPARHVVFVHPATWHAHVGPDYTKTDEGDAIAMGEVAVLQARAVLDSRATASPSAKRRRGARAPTKGDAA